MPCRPASWWIALASFVTCMRALTAMRPSRPTPRKSSNCFRRARLMVGKLPLVLALLIGIGNAGCTAVKPWERGTLADYTMRKDRDPLADSEYEHVYFTREEATGGRGVGGGGCGCN